MIIADVCPTLRSSKDLDNLIASSFKSIHVEESTSLRATDRSRRCLHFATCCRRRPCSLCSRPSWRRHQTKSPKTRKPTSTWQAFKSCWSKSTPPPCTQRYMTTRPGNSNMACSEKIAMLSRPFTGRSPKRPIVSLNWPNVKIKVVRAMARRRSARLLRRPLLKWQHRCLPSRRDRP